MASVAWHKPRGLSGERCTWWRNRSREEAALPSAAMHCRGARAIKIDIVLYYYKADSKCCGNDLRRPISHPELKESGSTGSRLSSMKVISHESSWPPSLDVLFSRAPVCPVNAELGYLPACLPAWLSRLCPEIAITPAITVIDYIRTRDSIVGGHQGSGKEAEIPKRREERSRSGFGGRRPLKKSTVQFFNKSRSHLLSIPRDDSYRADTKISAGHRWYPVMTPLLLAGRRLRYMHRKTEKEYRKRLSSPEVKEEALPWAIEGAGGKERRGGSRAEERHGNFSGAAPPYKALLIAKIVDETFLVDSIEENSSTLTKIHLIWKKNSLSRKKGLIEELLQFYE
ncbi:hypothetical protein EAG_14274 [Camponotus floridanus]|uniref:Uncharacterized protein n=1 Tax=Camponotus floridanus TaxID=104421 RepID=E2A4E4_CAMFO|nr:hypothetical protein EAG_14274 [Camponotus floridanus]